jgi:hypothetical protein
MFRKFRCGCIALSTPNNKGQYLVVIACDNNSGPEIDFIWRNLDNPGEGKILTEDQERELVRSIGDYIGDGYKFRELRRILGIRK